MKFILLLAIIITVLTAPVSVFADDYSSLKTRFDQAAAPLTLDNLSQAQVPSVYDVFDGQVGMPGACFDPNSIQPHLVTLVTLMTNDGGPEFPSRPLHIRIITNLQPGMDFRIPENVLIGDQAVPLSNQGQVAIFDNDVAVETDSTDSSPVFLQTLNIKKSSDGRLYAKILDTYSANSSVEYCYFWSNP